MKKTFSLSGIPDFNPFDSKRREYVLSIIKEKFNYFGFLPISTASVEKRSNLFGNYGSEGDKLIFQILKSGDYLSKVDIDADNIDAKSLASRISDKALRYDLTLPFARFVSENHSLINFPFKRYEIGSVWRADRPQKGRLREFTQCDADIIGSNSLWLEVDLLYLMQSIFKQIGFNNFKIKINNRKILEGVFISLNSNISFFDFCIILDKIDKIGIEKVEQLLLKGGVLKKDTTKIKKLISFQGDINEVGEYLYKNFQKNDILIEGFDDLSFILNQFKDDELDYIEFNIALARGLDYYTGSVFEVISFDNSFGSLAGGGRYDQLTEKFGVKNISGVGVSLGLDRLCLAMNEEGLFSDNEINSLDVLFINFGIEEAQVSQSYVNQIRDYNKSAELYPTSIKLNKQMSYANKRAAKFVAMVGEEELKINKIKVKNMKNGHQDLLTLSDLLILLKNNED